MPRCASFLAVLTLLLAAAGAAAEKAPARPDLPPAFVRQVRVVADHAPDCSSLARLVETVTRGAKTNDEKAIALYNFLRLANYHHAYPNEPGGISALKLINVYGWGLCGGLHTVEAALWREAGWPWRYVGWSGHTTVEAQYDGRWHYLDTFLKFYTWTPDPNAPGGRTIASQDDIKANPGLVSDGLVLDKSRQVYYHAGNAFEVIDGKANWTAPAFLVCGDEPGGVISGVRTGRNAGSPTGWAAIIFDDPAYSADVDLGPGYSLTLAWAAEDGAFWFSGGKNAPRHTCGDKDYRNCPAIGPILEPYALSGGKTRTWANGRLVFAPDLADPALLGTLAAADNARQDAGRLVAADAGRPASVTVLMASPYVLTRATGEAAGTDKAEVSVDDGKTFAPVDLKDFSKAVAGKYRCLVRLSFASALASLRIDATVQHNRCALPYLSPGANKVTVTVADPKALGANRLVVDYAWCPGSRSKSYEQLADAGAEVARAHNATWSDKPVAVRKIFAAADLPATLEIPVATPKDQYPVYPRMLMLRRAVLSPSAKPAPLPDGAAEPAVGPGDELKS
ncbi:MAG: transglutaminase domain-containing protein, partial [Planctomycetes bacterium]|nr:transglutaminase domain-containing protein [Planctomycetota bacterium]